MPLRKKGAMTWDEILGFLGAAMAVSILAILLFRLLSTGIDANEEYAEGVYEKLLEAADEARDGKGEFSILDVPVDYGDSVFLVLFKDEDYVSLSNYSVEVKNSGFMTYTKRVAGPVLGGSGRGYYSLLREAGLSDDVARAANDKIVKEVGELTVETLDDVLFKLDMKQIVRNFVTTTDSGLDAEKIIQEMLDANVGKGLAPADKIDDLAKALSKYIPEGGKVGRYNSIDTFMNTAKGLSKGNTWKILENELAFNIEAQKLIGEVGGDDAERMIKEMTDNTFAEGLDFDGKMDELKRILGDSVDDVDDAVKVINKGRSGRDALKVALGSTDDVADDVVKMATDNVLSIKSIPSDDVVRGVLKSNLGDEVAEQVILSSGKRLSGLTLKIAGKLAGAAFIVWEAYEYYNIAQSAQSRVLTALNQEDVSANNWVSWKLLEIDKDDDDKLCVCYVNDDYDKNICSDCVSFGKQITPEKEGENYWTFCEDVTLEDKGGGILLSSTIKEDCRPSIAFTNVECEASRIALVEELNSFDNRITGAGTSIIAGGGSGLLMGGIGGAIGGGIGFFFGGAGAVPGAVLGAKWGVAIGVAMGTVSGIEGVDFNCDRKGHIYLGGVSG